MSRASPGRSSVGVGDPGRLDGWRSPQEAVGERGDRGVLGGPGLPDGGGPRPHRLGVPATEPTMAPAAATSNTVIAPVRAGVGRRGQDGSGLPIR
jgi:hypothetical protein